MRKFLLFGLFSACCLKGITQTVLFSQDFNSSPSIFDYFNVNAPSTGQFNAYKVGLLIGTQTAPILTIANNRINIDRTAPTTAAAISITRSTDFSITPEVICFECDIDVTNVTSASTGTLTVEVGNAYSHTTAGALSASNSTSHSQFAVATASGDGPNDFHIRRISPGTNSDAFTGSQHITWIVNNANADHYYLAPNGTFEVVGIDKADIWVGTQQIFDETLAKSAGQAITDVRITSTAGNFNLTIDNLVITALPLMASPPPVTLASFTATKLEKSVRLDWITATENNNNRFEIEKSTNGTTYSILKTVPGNGTPSTYTLTDSFPVYGDNHYRLVQYDNNGTRTDLGVRTVNFERPADILLNVFPNPVTSDTRISLTNYRGTALSLSLFDMSGRLLRRQVVPTDPNPVNTVIPLHLHLVPGMYILQLNGDGIKQSIKLLAP